MKILILFLFASSIGAATLLSKDYVYTFDDDGVKRYCVPPKTYLSETVICFTPTALHECKLLKIHDGYIDCKGN